MQNVDLLKQGRNFCCIKKKKYKYIEYKYKAKESMK